MIPPGTGCGIGCNWIKPPFMTSVASRSSLWGFVIPGDLPPRPECAPQWHELLLAELPEIRLTLLVGQYAQRYYLPERGKSLTDNVREYRRALAQGYFPLPHPSPRNRLWLRQRPWFEDEVVPALQAKVAQALM